MLQHTEHGIYCQKGDFYIDPLRSVERAIITHAHSDHARRGMASYLCHPHTESQLRARLGKNIHCQTLEYGVQIQINGVTVSLHPAGHVAGSAQVRVEWKGQVWVASGDYKRESDPFAQEFEVVRCNTFITESTFGLPVYNWPDQRNTIHEIDEWWRYNASNGMPSVLSAYSLGKAQHILGSIDSTIGPLYVHPAVEQMNAAMRSVGLLVPPTQILTPVATRSQLGTALVISPNIGDGPDWMQDDFAFAHARASGWFAVKRTGRRQPGERGFVLSDHADWKGLTQTIRETECEQVFVNHGFSKQLARWARELGRDASELEENGEKEKERNGKREKGRKGDGGRIRDFVCKETGIAEWLFDECCDHVGNLSETVALLLPKETLLPEFFGKRIIKSVVEIQEQNSIGFGREALPFKRNVEHKAYSIKPKAYTIIACLMHVHLKSGGRRGFDKFTMGVWLGDELIPLAHVAPTTDPQLIDAITTHMKDHTLVRSGPVRTIAPKFVFEISIAGIDTAPRRKSGVSVSEAVIVAYISDVLPQSAAALADVMAML